MRKVHWSRRLFNYLNVLALAGIALVTLYPFLYVVFASISDPVELMGNSSLLWKPIGFSLAVTIHGVEKTD
ncbi:MAG: hypothetical protein LIP11_16545 [Clostridiales bacterium]|nr:hypothetical protein [Clostridiales bacterium]